MPPTGPSRASRNAPIPRQPHASRRDFPPRREGLDYRREKPRRESGPPERPKGGQEKARPGHEEAAAKTDHPSPTDKIIVDPPPSFDINDVGPHPGYIMQTEKFVREWRIQQMLKKLGTELKDEQWRIQGVSLMEQANALLLKAMPMFTITTATAFFHRFRLQHSLEQHHLVEVVASALYLASKTENTAQKPNQIAAACFNVGVPPLERRLPEDDFFDAMSDRIVDLERLMLEATSFEFAYLDPKRIVLETLSHHFHISWKAGAAEDDDIIRLALELAKDLNYTFAVVKHSVMANAIAIAELAMRLSDRSLKWDSLLRPGRPLDAETEARIVAYEAKLGGRSEKLRDAQNPYRIFLTSRVQVMETMFDLMDLYTVHRTATHAGKRFTNEQIMQHKIALNRIAQRHEVPRHARWPADEEKTSESDYVHKLKLERDVLIAAPPPPPPPPSSAAPMPAADDAPARTNGQPMAGEQQQQPPLAEAVVERRQVIAVRRFVLQGTEARREKGVLDEYFLTNEEEYDREHEEEDGWESVSSEEDNERGARR